jgi:hypothetical protein
VQQVGYGPNDIVRNGSLSALEVKTGGDIARLETRSDVNLIRMHSNEPLTKQEFPSEIKRDLKLTLTGKWANAEKIYVDVASPDG